MPKEYAVRWALGKLKLILYYSYSYYTADLWRSEVSHYS